MANQIVTNVKGIPERYSGQQQLSQAYSNLASELAQTLKAFVDSEVAKVNAGMNPPKTEGGTDAHQSTSH
jgi:hypothetical protein